MNNDDIDPAIMAALPSGCEIIAVTEHGTASWSSGYKIELEVNGEEKEYFLKVLYRENHAEMALAEYESQNAMYQYIPEHVVAPLAQGQFQNDSSKSFFLASFHDFKDKVPEAKPLIQLLKKLHTSSVSPTGKFGFHVTTFNGFVPLRNEWCDTWEEWFSRQLRSDIEWEQSIRGNDPDFNDVAEQFFAKVIPRLLRPLQSGGRTIKPVLVHGDLWHGNVHVDATTSNVVLFDSCCCYAHNELELHMMREPRYRFSNTHVQMYREMVGVSEPVEDFDDRNALYAMRDNIINAGLHEHRAYLRQQVKEEMQRLLEKHPHGFEGFEERPTVEQTVVTEIPQLDSVLGVTRIPTMAS